MLFHDNLDNIYSSLNKAVVCGGNFNLNCLLIELVIPNLSRILFCKPEIF